MWKLRIICDDFRVFCVLKNLEIRKNLENSHASCQKALSMGLFSEKKNTRNCILYSSTLIQGLVIVVDLIYKWLIHRHGNIYIYIYIYIVRNTVWVLHVPDIHYSDIKIGAMASQITSFTIVYSTVYSGAVKDNIKAPRHCPLCGEFTGDRWIPRTKGQ